MEYENLSSREIAFLALQAGMSVTEWKAEQDRLSAGKDDDSTETTPPPSQQDTPAGESSSGDTSLESQGVQIFDPATLKNTPIITGGDADSYMGVGPAYVNEFGVDRGAARAEEVHQEALTQRNERVKALEDDPEYQGNDQLFEAIDAMGKTGGYGGVDETAGRKRLETLFGSLTSEWNNGGEGFDFVETTPMMDYVRVDYIDKNGIRHEGPELSFDEKDEEDIATNTKALKEFVALWEKNGDAKLSLDWENLTKEVKEETDGLILPEERSDIEARINEPDIFTPYWKSTGETGASRGAAVGGGYSASGQARTWIEPYKDELAYAEQEVLERNKKKGVEMTPDELDVAVKEQARKNIIATEIDELAHRKARAKLRKAGTAIVDPDGEYARSEFEVAGVIETSRINVKKDKLEYTEKRMTEVVNMIDELGRHVQDPGALSEEELKNLTVRLLEHSIYIDPTDQELITLEDGTVMPRQYVKAFREMVDLIDGYNAVRDKHIDDLLSSLDEIEDLEIYRQEASKSYDVGDKALTEVAAGFGDLALGAAMVLSRANLPLTIWAMADKDSMAAQMLNGVDNMLMNASMALQDWRDDYVANISFEEAFESGENFGLFALQEVSTQIPILTAMIASGGYASVVIGATSMGGNMIEMEIANKYGGEDYSDGEILLKSLGVGLAEGVFAELTTTRVLKNVKSKWAGVGKESALKNTRTQFIKDNYLELGLEPIAEATGEVLTAASQNLIMGRDMMEGLDHAGFSGFGMGLVMQAVPFMRGVYLSGNSSYASRQTIRDYQTDIARLTLELENATTPEAKAAIVEKIGRNQREMANEISRVEKLVDNNYRGVHAEKVRILAGKQAEIQNEVAAIMQNKNLTKDQKQEQVDKLELEFQRLQKKKEASLDPRNMQKARPEFELLEDTEKGRYNRLLDEAQDALVKEKGENAKLTDEQIKDKAYDLYFSEEVRKNNAEAANVEGAELTSFETKEELIDLIANDGIRFEADDAKNEVAKAEAMNVINQGGDGFNVGNKQFVVVENQLENQRLHIGTHEVGHYVFDRLVKNNPKAFDKIAESLLKHTRNTDKALYKELSQETKGYEVISRFLEMVAAGKIDYREVRKHRGLLGMFGVNMQHTLKGEYNFDFKGEQDIVNFVVGMGKKIADGTLTIRDIEAAESGTAINKVKIEAEARKRKGIDIIKNTKFSSRAADRASRQLAEMQEQGYDPNNFELYDILNGMVSAQLSKYKAKGLEITDMEEAVADVVGRLYTERDVNKFDGRGTLYGYLNGRIKFRILDAFKNNPIWVENFGEVDAEGLQGKEVQKVSVEAVEDTKTVADKPAYRSITEAKVISMEGMQTIKEKVLSTVRVMKKRIDESVSKNVTVKPYIAELKKDFGKQVDIIVKKEMGGLKDRQLQKWLLKNKKAILENMTTTWMMTAMPNAIQKKVDGQWTSDWKGKKIDREKTTTDNAGRTSGAELVRRLPMASINMSDADFLSNFFNADGSLIRGRKESLAKAVAEEVSFELFSTELQTEGSPIREAFMMRQDLLQAELTENFATEVNRDIERGNVKFSRADVDTSLEGIDAYLRGDESVAEILFSKLPKALADRVTTFINDQLIGIGLEGFKSPLKDAVYPDSVGEILSTYLGGITNKKNKQAIDQMLDFTEELLDNLPPELVAHLPKDIFGMHYRYANHNQFKRAAALNAKREAKGNEASGEVLPFNPANIRIFQGGTGLMSQIVNNVLNKDFDTKEAKIEAFKELAGLTVEEASIANKAALEYILDKTFEIVTKDPNKMVGVLRLFEGQTNMGQSLRGLTGLADVEFYAKSQGAYYNTKTGKYYSTLSAAQKKKLGGEIVVNKNHPLYNDAVKYIEEFNARSKKPSKLKPEDLLNFKGEHALPSAKMWFGIADIMLNRLAKAIDNPSTIEAERVAARIEMKELVDQFDQQLNSILVSNIQDRVLGATSEAGDFRLGALSKSQQNAFHQTTDGQQTIGRVRRKMSEVLDLNKYVEAVDELSESTKFSRSKPRAVFMVGGPGAGKTNVGKGLKLGRRGFKVVNQDLALEPMKADAGLPANEQQYTKEQRSMRAKLGAQARKAAEAKMAKYANNHESMVVDGTGASYNATMKKVNALREAGYEVSIVFANTSKAEAVSRNKARAERALPDHIVERTWDAVQESAKLYKEEFSDKFYELDTDALKMGENLPTEFLEKLYNDLDVNPNTKFSEAKKIDTEFNEMLERKTGMGAKKTFSKVQAELRGRKKGKFKWFVAPGADDFRGLVHYAFAGKGKQGDADMAWFEEKLMDPYFKGVEAINRMRQQIKRDFKAVIKLMRPQYKMLNKRIGDSEFTYDHAVRAYLWNKAGIEVPGLSKRDKKLLLDAVNKNPELAKLADALLVVSRKDQWAEPSDYWQNQTILSDLNSMTEKIGRKKFLQEFIDNAEVIFSEDNLNKIEALYGRAHREAIEDALYSMTNGTNRPTGNNATVNKFINWINGSTGAIMFFNRRSALLQMLSAANFINWSDNNPVKAAAAFANQKQYWSDWAMIFNSDKLKERRSGLKTDVSESELASVANRSKGDPQAILAYLLKLGFTPTQIADSMAIATGGASFYRNRVNKYIKQGLDKKEAEESAWLDFTKKSDEAQQSSDPALVSQQQRSVLGRLVFAFANTPMQYTRLMKKAAMDLKNGRGDAKENISKILYYGFAQNFIFSSLQSALFAMLPGFDEEDEDLTDEEMQKLSDKEEAKIVRVLNGMMDTILRGSGVYGAVGVTLKNTLMEYAKQEEKGFLADHTYTVIQATSISPPINSKLRKIYSAIQTKKFERDELEVRPWGVQTDGRPNFGPAWSITGSLVSGVLNVPLDRIVDEMNSIGEAMDARNSTWQRIALALGWKTWDVGAVDEEGEEIKAEGKARRKQEGIDKAKETRRKNKEKKDKEAAENTANVMDQLKNLSAEDVKALQEKQRKGK